MQDPIERAGEHHRAGRRAEAEALCREALARHPHDAKALHLLAVMAHRQSRLRPAARLGRMAVDAAPGVPDYHNTLATVLADLGRWDEAVAGLREALRLRPDYAEALHNLGLTLARAGRPLEALGPYRDALGLDPANVATLTHLGDALRATGRLSEAAECYERALGLDPGRVDAMGGLATACAERGRAAEAAAWQRRVADARPDSAAAGSDLLFLLLHADGLNPQALYDEHVRWSRRHTPPVEPGTFPNDRDPERRLRVGYVSPDFRRHPVAAFLEPVLQSHDPAAVGVYCYNDAARPDATTARLKALGHGWRDVAGRADAEVEAQVRADRIDVLVDLAGHTGGNRLPLFARGPAPVQVTWIGYPATTGVPRIGYRITDAWHDPPGETEAYHTERLVRLPGGCWCWRPDGDEPDSGGPPAARAGGVTFAVLQRMLKVNDRMARVWARVLAAVPTGRLMVLVGHEAEEDPGVLGLFARNGIAPDRLRLVGRRSRTDYLALYHEADMALDTFPYNGHTTTCDALWMGVPTVTLAGGTHVSRAGLGLLTAVGLPELIAHTEDDYVRIAADLAADLPRLADLRRTLRPRMAASPLCDGPAFGRKLEDAYRLMWREWCRDGQTSRR